MDWNAPAVRIAIRSSHPLAKDVILSLISLDYDDTLMAAAGAEPKEVLTRLAHHSLRREIHILAVEVIRR